jgi:transcription termination/antitermination protein NusG
MPDERNNRPQTGKPDAATLAQQLFRDEPEEDEPESQPGAADPQTQAPSGGPAPDTSGSSVGVLVPPGEEAEAVERLENGAVPADTGTITAEGIVEVPPGVELPGVEPVSPEDEAARAARGARWFVIHTYSGYENKVRTNLERRIASMGQAEKIFRILVPTEDEIEIKDGKRRIAKKKVFPGYVLVEMIMDDDSWYVVRNTPGVTGFVGSGAKPLPLQDREVKTILKQLGDETPKFRITYQKGSAVRINSGPFMDFSGVVDEILPEKEKVRVLVSIFGRETPVELDFAQVEKI